jgi:UDP-GlcNAc:undecaprenyl-phosphate/decaprenyl-phosphate GlcNAc-1-phosphate transferase
MMKYLPFFTLFLSSAVLSALITPLLHKIAMENGVVDVPNERKIHQQVIPRIGGISIAISFFIAIVLGYGLFHVDLTVSISSLTGLCIGGTLVLLVGVVDDIDIKGLRASKKFIGQFIAALTLVPFGFVIDRLHLPVIGIVNVDLIVGLALTIVWVIGIINALNLIDGMDGLASGIAMLASIALIILSILSGKLLMTIVLIAILGSTLGFLYYNWPPAKIFLGDCGAMFLGFLLAAVSIETSFKSNGLEPSMLANVTFVPILALGVPILDTMAAIVRRLWHRKPVFSPDRKHIHHRLLDAGFTVRQANLILYGVSIVLGVTALSTTMARILTAMGIVTLVMLLALLGIRILNKDRKARLRQVAVPKSPI